MTHEQILTLVRAYGDARAAQEAADIVLKSATKARSDAAYLRAVEALSDAHDALRAVESALASLTQDR